MLKDWSRGEEDRKLRRRQDGLEGPGREAVGGGGR
jgi:hypothetical protein